MVNHRGPLPLKELHSTGETIVWRNPGGSWACLLPVYVCVWNHPATGCDMWTTPAKQAQKRETLRHANQNKATRRAGYKVYEKKDPKQAFRIQGVLCKAGSFSYGESPRTPPLEGTSLHRWNNSVERPWGILSLFTTCLRLRVKSPCLRHVTCRLPQKSTLRREKH